MKRRTRSPKIHPLARATAAVLIGLVIAPTLPAKNPFAIDHTGQQEETEFRSASTDSVISQGANAALDEVVSFVGDSNLPFLGSLQGGVTYDHENGLLRYNLSTVGKFYGNGTGHHWLGQIGAHNEADRDTVNAGLIYRWIDVNKAWLIGTNLFYDHDFDTGAKRAGFGVEAATHQWRVFSNLYRGIANEWRDALVDGDKWEERVADGYDLGSTWSPAALPALDLQLKASRWLGSVDVFDNGVLHGDPLVWSAKVGYTPIPLISVAFEQERVVNGDTNNRVDLQFTYRFGQSLAEQLEPSNVARRNDIAARALAPVERQHRIVMEKREKQAPARSSSAVAMVRMTLAADEKLAHGLFVTGGVGAIAFSLEGRDANRFRIVNNHLELAPEVAARKSLAVPAPPATEELHVTVVARDTRGGEARQGFEIIREKKQTPVDGQAPVASALAMQGELTRRQHRHRVVHLQRSGQRRRRRHARAVVSRERCCRYAAHGDRRCDDVVVHHRRRGCRQLPRGRSHAGRATGTSAEGLPVSLVSARRHGCRRRSRQGPDHAGADDRRHRRRRRNADRHAARLPRRRRRWRRHAPLPVVSRHRCGRHDAHADRRRERAAVHDH